LLTKNGNVQSAVKLVGEAFVELRQSLVTTFDAASCHYTSKDTVANNDVEQYTIRSVDADMKDFSKHGNPLYLFKRAILIDGCDQILVPRTAL
jgi:hypothetical protein